MDKLEILYDHYKVTCRLNLETQKRRNKHFIILCVLEIAMSLILSYGNLLLCMLRQVMSKQIDVNFELGNDAIQTFFWILLVYYLIVYCQASLYVEKQYVYIVQLEKELSDDTASAIFNREGTNYLSEYPIVLNLIDLFYKLFIPILFLIVNSMLIYKECCYTPLSNGLFLIDVTMFLVLFVITWFYFFEIHGSFTEYCEKKCPLINWLAKTIRKLLREV